MNNKVRYITRSAIIAALYVVLSMLSQLVGLCSGPVQFRLGEALCILPYFSGAAIPGLTIGCLISNILSGCQLLDVVFGTLATLAGAILTWSLRGKSLWLAPVPPIVSNTVALPFIMRLVYKFPGSYFYHLLTIFIGEFVTCGIIGMLLAYALKKRNIESL